MSHSFLSTNANEVKPGTFNQHHAEDEGMSIRKSHENPEVLLLYQNFLGQPLGKKIATLATHKLPQKKLILATYT